MKAIRVKPRRSPEVIDIEDELDVLQNEVGGYIQVLYPFEDPVGIVCDDDDKLKGYEENRVLLDEDGDPYDVLVGTFLIVGLNEDCFGDLSDELCKKYMQKFNKLHAMIVPFGLVYIDDNDQAVFAEFE